MTTIISRYAGKWDAQFRALVGDEIFPNVVSRALFAGFYRSGKSTLPRKLWACENVTMHKSMPVDDMIGGYVLREGSTQWADGPLVRAMRCGKPVVLDEIDQYSADTRCLLHAALDDPPAVTLPSGERVTATQGYAVIATTNADPRTLPQGIYDRFDLIVRVDTLSEGLRTQLGNMADAAEAVAGRGIDWINGWQRPPSVNLFLAAAKLRRHGMPDEDIGHALGLVGLAYTDFLAVIANRT